MSCRHFAIVAITLLITSCSKQVSDPCLQKDKIKDLSGELDSIVSFDTIDSYDLNLKNKETITINGQLFFPNRSCPSDNYLFRKARCPLSKSIFENAR